MLRVGHTGDVHIGSFLGHGPVGSDGVPLRLRDQARTFRLTCEAMRDAEVDLALISGDVFRSPKPSPTEINAAIEGLQVLRRANIPVVIPSGNHDYSGTKGEVSAVDVLAEEGVITVRYPTFLRVDSQEGPLCQLVCVPYFRRSHVMADDVDLTRDQADALCAERSAAVTMGLLAQADHTDSHLPILGCVHHNITGAIVGGTGFGFGSGSDPFVPLEALTHPAYTYVACGHIHKAQDLSDRVRYCGSPHALDFSEEKDPKSWTLVEIDVPVERSARWRAIVDYPTDSRPLRTVDLNFTEVEDPTLLHPLRQQLAAGAGLEGAIVRLRYTAHRAQQPAISHAEILRLLAAAGAWHVHSIQPTWIEAGQVTRVEGLSTTLNIDEVVRRFLEAEAADHAHDVPALLELNRNIFQEVQLAQYPDAA